MSPVSADSTRQGSSFPRPGWRWWFTPWPRPGDGFDDGRVIGFALAGLALLAAFVFVELRSSAPMLDVRIFANSLFRACNIAWLVTMFGFSSTIFLITLELQANRGMSAIESGLATFPMAVGVMIVAQPASRIYGVIGPRRMILAGLTITALCTIVFWRVDLGTSEWLIRGLMLIRGLGFGLVLVPLQAATYAQIDAKDTGRATALYNVTSQVAASLGVALAATLLTSRLSSHGAILGAPPTRLASLDAFQDVFLIMGLISVASVAVAFLIHDAHARSTMREVSHRPGPSPGSAIAEPGDPA